MSDERLEALIAEAKAEVKAAKKHPWAEAWIYAASLRLDELKARCLKLRDKRKGEK